ncbi:hypothetical protein B0T10DRAFT_467588 [Thelonectria olida]|uniref:Uncharacterized protein n=1 Tax=Thelonectria olida TaxID=1576542 RepID=A0A9P9AHH1_9HYPO|nr:hypothetical protein B0T10DRAFT_467588 [Thelonectria olida]
MGSLWISAADPKADTISMVKSMPLGGFKHVPNRAEPTLRSCLVDGSHSIQEETTKIENKFAVQAQEDAKELVKQAADSLKKAEKRLDQAIDKVPGPLEGMISGLVSGYTQAIPNIMSSVVPQLLAASNPGLATTAAVVGNPMSQTAAANRTAGAGWGNGSTAAPTMNSDPAYAAATGVRELVDFLYQYAVNLESLICPSPKESSQSQLGQFEELYLISEIGQHLKDQNEVSGGKLSDHKIKSWKTTVKKAVGDVLELTSAANVGSSSSVPQPFANVVGPKPDDKALKGYGSDEPNPAEPEATSKGRGNPGRDQVCLAQLHQCSGRSGGSNQQDRTFFIMLTTVIDNSIMVRANDFTKKLDKAGRRALANGMPRVHELAKATIYTSTLQLKGYLSLLHDISAMYTIVDKPCVRNDLDLCGQLSKGATSGNASAAMQEKMQKHMDETGQVIKDLVAKKQKEILDGLKDRVKKAAETTQLVEETIQKSGVALAQDAKASIEAGTKAAKMEAKKEIDARHSETVLASENAGASDY